VNKRLTALRDHVRNGAENRPGIYRMFGPAGELLYVGKSIQVRTRLLSYFRARRGEKASEIVSHAHRIDWEYTSSEFGALLAELRSIKRAEPVFNVEHKHDRAHCFVKLTREPAPRLLMANSVVADGALYFGPYAGRSRVRDVLREIADLFELRDCKSNVPMRFADQLDFFTPDRVPRCMRADLGRCLGPCAARCSQQQYTARVEQTRRFLEGDIDKPLSILRSRMETASERMQFEYAAQLRDRSERLEHVVKEMVALRGTIESLSFVYEVEGFGGDHRWYVLKRGTVRQDLPAPRTKSERRATLEGARALLEAYEPVTAEVPPHQIAEILLIARWFRLRPQELGRTYTLSDLFSLARKEPDTHPADPSRHRSPRSSRRRKQSIGGLTAAPAGS
jgi:excinuclease ABC subunit C